MRLITPEGFDMYRKNRTKNIYDPGRGRTFPPPTLFYKHVIPPGLGSIIAFGIELNYRMGMKPTSERSYVYRNSGYEEYPTLVPTMAISFSINM
jgi:hypothetical protein